MPETAAPGYQVLARTYRPQTFADLIGQEAMVRTLRNAFASGRIAHAFLLTGVRGVGKTTTARILARGLNCVGPDGAGGPTIEPCGLCEPCRAIAEGRHVDVLEMDAASRTGVGDIREIIESVAYRAAAARFKIYIIDEVHMLSTSAFNALLKTLEEPPPHVKFIFATTEIHKVPVTVLSRCQRFDLRRIEPEAMIAHLARICAREGAAVAPEALALIARAAEGSVRDAMSLLDQAIAHGAGEGAGDGAAEISAVQVRAMLGLADRGRVLDLFDLIMRGEAAGALAELSAQYAAGADPAAVLRDLAEIAHWLSVLRVAPEAAEDPAIAPEERMRGREMVRHLPMRALARAWQMLLKALEEVALAPNAMMAAEMAVIRLTHVADLPSPEELVRRLQAAPPEGGGGARAPQAPAPRAMPSGEASATAPRMPSGALSGGAAPALAQAPDPLAGFPGFEQVVALIRDRRDVKLLVEVETALRLVRYAPGRIEFQPTAAAPPDLAARLGQRLQAWTGVRWGVSVVASGGGATAAEARDGAFAREKAEALQSPLVQAVLAAFPGAEITSVRRPEAQAEAAAVEALPGSPDDDTPEDGADDWNPFETD